MVDRKALEEKFVSHGFRDFTWINPGKIVVSQWVRMKCIFGCNEYGRTASCPPNLPPVSDCEKFFQEYRKAALFHVPKKVKRPEDRFAWTRGGQPEAFGTGAGDLP